MRYLKKIQSYEQWAKDLEPLALRFEPHLDGRGIIKIMKGKCPEELFWRHLDYIYRHWDKMTNREA